MPAGKKNDTEKPVEESPVLLNCARRSFLKPSLNFKTSFSFALSVISAYAYGFKHLQCIYIYPQLQGIYKLQGDLLLIATSSVDYLTIDVGSQAIKQILGRNIFKLLLAHQQISETDVTVIPCS